MGPKNFFASKKIFKLADARSTFDASIESCGRCSGQIFKGKCYVNFTLGLLLSFIFFLSGAWAAGAPCPLRAGLTAGVAGGRRPPVSGGRQADRRPQADRSRQATGAVRRPEAAGRPTGGTARRGTRRARETQHGRRRRACGRVEVDHHQRAPAAAPLTATPRRKPGRC